MFRKIHSSEKDTTIFQEFRKEFSGIFSREEERATSFISMYPRQIFIGMIAMIIISSIIAFVFAPFEMDSKNPGELFYEEAINIRNGMSGEISTILDLSDRAKRISTLKSEVERIIKQDKITEEDSVFLENAILELEYFDNQNKKNHED